MQRAWELGANVTPHDATYVALAEVLGGELWTADQRLAKAPRPYLHNPGPELTGHMLAGECQEPSITEQAVR